MNTSFRVLAAACAGLAAAAAAAPIRTNVVLILADDLGYGDLGCYGHPEFQTPRLDRMAAEGVRLTQFNTPMAFCAPTRASLMTGRHPVRCGMTGNPAPDGKPEADEIHLPESEITLAQLFRHAGYATALFGKWHLGHARPEWMPPGRGFDEFFGIAYSNDMRPVELIDGSAVVEYPLVQATLTRRLTDRALSFIEKNRAAPFFLYLAHPMPHKPLAASEAYYKKSGRGLYADVVSELDACVGEVLDKLAELGLDDRTFVVFTSDNGPWFGGSTGGLRGMKGSTYEGGFRVPCIARWPGRLPAGQTRDQLAVTMDLFATALAAAGVEPPADRTIDGQNLLPVLADNAPGPHEAILLGKEFAVRDARWKLHVRPASDPMRRHHAVPPGERWIDPRGPDGVTILAPFEQYDPTFSTGVMTGDAPAPMQLFDLHDDPAEQTDVAARHPEIVRRLKAEFDRLIRVD
jgi:uncharacterized sulfatase